MADFFCFFEPTLDFSAEFFSSDVTLYFPFEPKKPPHLPGECKKRRNHDMHNTGMASTNRSERVAAHMSAYCYACRALLPTPVPFF